MSITDLTNATITIHNELTELVQLYSFLQTSCIINRFSPDVFFVYSVDIFTDFQN